MSIHILFLPGRLFNFSLSSETQGEVGGTSLICPIIFSSSPDGRQHYGDSTSLSHILLLLASCLSHLQSLSHQNHVFLSRWDFEAFCLLLYLHLLHLWYQPNSFCFSSKEIHPECQGDPITPLIFFLFSNLQGGPTTFQTRLSSGNPSSFSLSSSSSSLPWKVHTLLS